MNPRPSNLLAVVNNWSCRDIRCLRFINRFHSCNGGSTLWISAVTENGSLSRHPAAQGFSENKPGRHPVKLATAVHGDCQCCANSAHLRVGEASDPIDQRCDGNTLDRIKVRC
jgi:hypothetical protein